MYSLRLGTWELCDRRHVDCIWLKVTHIQLAEMSLSYTRNDINMIFCLVLLTIKHQVVKEVSTCEESDFIARVKIYIF